MSKVSENQSGFSIIETLLVLLFIGVIGLIGYYVWHHQKSANSTMAQSDPSMLLTFIDKSDMRVVWEGKTVKTISLVNGNDTFTVLANNGQEALVKQYNWDKDSGFIYYLITKDGANQLSDPIVSALNNVDSPSSTLLDHNNNYLFVSCDNTANTTAPNTRCTLKSFNLGSGDSKNIYSTPIDVADANGSWLQGQTTIYLLGVAPNGNIYAVVQSHNLDLGKSLIKVISPSGSIVKSVAAPQINQAVISPDLKYVAYEPSSTPSPSGIVATSNSNELKVTNILTGKTLTVTSSQTQGFNFIAWSPDSEKIAYTTQGNTAYTSSTNSISYSSITSPKVTKLTDIPTSSDNGKPIILGWSTDSDINYASPTTNSASINIASKEITKSPEPTGYQLVTPFSNNNDAPFDD